MRETGEIKNQNKRHWDKLSFTFILIFVSCSSFLSLQVPCDLVLSVKPQSMKPSARWHDVYEIEPQRASIPAHSYVYASVTFSPPSMQTYNATLEAAVDGMPSAMSKYRNLTFDIQGEGNLPRITVVRPTARNKKGAPVLLFRRLLLGRTQVPEEIQTNLSLRIRIFLCYGHFLTAESLVHFLKQ